jgi:hypothetical protein
LGRSDRWPGAGTGKQGDRESENYLSKAATTYEKKREALIAKEKQTEDQKTAEEEVINSYQKSLTPIFILNNP